ncbi:MAG: DUF4097 family beta strand repeat-containing protein [Clostridiales bacterium]|jgi:DUF4097 and DUF4098 domain-containing protein YvlB|nr:DUF4097 family beta strand repeat-containing protein [Eubacteriales bacterium]MDH7567692.1 DUF4097 family beta strand repeat-containing protein [Clostridiales bacterium]
MSFSEEKMLILKMLEEGKITSEQAAKLIEALEENTRPAGGDSGARQQKQPNFQDEVSKVRERIQQWKKEFKSSYSQKDFDRLLDEFSEKAEKLGKNLAATTVGVVDKVVDFVGSFVDTNVFNLFGSLPVEERSFEAPADEGMELEVEGVNGQIVVKKHLENKVVIKSRVRSTVNNADEILRFSSNGGNVSLKLNKYGNISVSQEVYLPAAKFKKIKLETTNGKIYVEDSLSESFEAATRNSHIDLMGVNSEKIAVSTKNARIQLSYVIGRDISIDTSNSLIDIKNLRAEKLKAVTTNGKISVENVQNYRDSQEVNLQLKTSNNSIKVNMNDMDNKGYKIKAQTVNGSVNLLIPEIIYHNINKQINGSFIEAETRDYSNYPERVNINAETINGYIEIVK